MDGAYGEWSRPILLRRGLLWLVIVIHDTAYGGGSKRTCKQLTQLSTTTMTTTWVKSLWRQVGLCYEWVEVTNLFSRNGVDGARSTRPEFTVRVHRSRLRHVLNPFVLGSCSNNWTDNWMSTVLHESIFRSPDGLD